MQNTNEVEQVTRQLMRHAWQHPWRWLLPTMLVTGLGLAYAAVLYERDWVASQALTVREDYAEGSEWDGQSNEAEQLKHAQETFLELARSPSVVEAALRSVGPPKRCQTPQQWPSAEDVAEAREKTEVLAPNGLEFGTTRMFYLNIADPDPQRAIQLATAICDESEKRFKQLRDQDMKNVIAELTNTVELAERELDSATTELQEMETSAGSDLAELRMLSESFAGDGNLHTTLSEVQQELRQAESTYSANQQLLNLLTAAQEDPSSLVATPNRLLEAQPALRRLKEGLIDAQLSSSQLLGTMSNEHPRVKAAMVAESEIRGHLHRELEMAVRGVRAEQALLDIQIATLTKNVEDVRQRLRKLAQMRASYTNQLAEVRERTSGLTTAQQGLNRSRANLAAGDVITLVTRVESPQTGPNPEGPGRSMIAAAATAGGLLFGLGILVLTLPTPTKQVIATTPVAAEPAAVAERAVAPEPAPTPAPHVQTTPTPPAPVARPPAPLTAQQVSAVLPERNLTLKEALARCSGWNA